MNKPAQKSGILRQAREKLSRSFSRAAIAMERGLVELGKASFAVLRFLWMPILWWGHKFKEEPTQAVLMLVYLAAGIAVAGNLVLRYWRPESVLLVAPFELSSAGPASLAVTGKTVANVFADQIKKFVDEAGRYTSRSPADQKTIQEVLLAIGASIGPQSIEIGESGFSLERLVAELKGIRQNQIIIEGDVILGSQELLLKARMRGTPWTGTSGPYKPTGTGLEAACQELALEVLSYFKPPIAGIVYQKRGQLDKAVEVYHSWLGRGPLDQRDKAHAHFLLGVALDMQGELDKALANYEEALRLEPAFPEALNNVGLLLYRKGQVEEAVKYFRRSIALDSRSPVPLVHLGNALDRQDDYGGAIEAYTKAIALASQVPEIHYNLATTLEKARRGEEAKKEFAEADRLFRLRSPKR